MSELGQPLDYYIAVCIFKSNTLPFFSYFSNFILTREQRWNFMRKMTDFTDFTSCVKIYKIPFQKLM